MRVRCHRCAHAHLRSRSRLVLPVWDLKPEDSSLPINMVELKTSAEIENVRDQTKFERKLLKFWIQSFLLGVPKIVVGFRTSSGILQRIEELDTQSIPEKVTGRGRGLWDGNTCINFAISFLECQEPGGNARKTGTDDFCRAQDHNYQRWTVENPQTAANATARSIQARGWSR